MNFKELREKSGVTQAYLAEMAGITPVQLSRIENGQAFPHKTTRDKLEQALGKKVDWIKTRLQQSFHAGSMDNESDEEIVCRSISIFIKSGQVDERAERLDFLRKFIRNINP